MITAATDGYAIDLEGGRRVEVWRTSEPDGYAVRIFRPTNDGKTSCLAFGLSPEAAGALLTGLSQHLKTE